MKTLRTLLTLILFVVAGTVFGNEKFISAMEKGIDMIEKAKTADEVQLAANYFERIASAEPKEWTPLYYAAYANFNLNFYQKDGTKKDELFNKALEQLTAAEVLSKNNSEIYTLKGYCVLMKLTVDPTARAASMMPEGMALLARAKAFNPANPRPYLVEGQFTFYMPEAFGGGKAKAKPILETGKRKYDAEKQATTIDPAWGKKSLEDLLAKCG